MKMSFWLLVSPRTRLDAAEENAMVLPSAEIELHLLSALACVPAESTLTRVVVFATVSRMKTSYVAFVSPGTRALSVSNVT